MAKRKVIPVQAMKAYRDSKGRTPLIFDQGIRWEWLAQALAALTKVKGHTVSIQQQDVSSNAKAKF